MDPILGFLEAISSVTGILSLIAFLATIGAFVFRELLQRELLSQRLAALFDRSTLRLIIILSFITGWLLIAAYLIPTLVTTDPPTPTAPPSVIITETPEIEEEITTETPEPTETDIACPSYPLRVGELIEVDEVITLDNVTAVEKIAHWSYPDSFDAEFLAYGQDAETIILGMNDGSLRLLTASTGDLITELNKHQLRLTDLTVQTSRGTGVSLFGSSSMDSSANLWILKGDETSVLKTVKRDNIAVTTVAFSPIRNDLVATGDGLNRVNLWSLAASRYYDFRDEEMWLDEEVQQEGGFFVSDSSFSNDGQLLAVASTDGTIQVFNVHRNEDVSRAWLDLKREIQPEFVSPFRLVTFSPVDRKRLYAASDQGFLSIYNAETGELLGTGSSTGPVVDFTYTQDGSVLAGLSRTDESSIIHIWNEYGDDIKILDYPSNGYSIKFSPDGRTLIVSDRDGIDIYGIGLCGSG
jgi:WD40 repeat protein